MFEDDRCDFMGCNLEGRFTDEELGDKKYCAHHRQVRMDAKKEQAHADEVAELKKEALELRQLGMEMVNATEAIGYVSQRSGKTRFGNALRNLREYLCKR